MLQDRFRVCAQQKLTRLFLLLCILLARIISASSFTADVEAAAKIKLNKKSVTLTRGKSATLKLKSTKKKAKWTSSNKKVATVTQKGKVTAVNPKPKQKPKPQTPTPTVTPKPATPTPTAAPKPQTPTPTPVYGDSGENWKYHADIYNTDGPVAYEIDGYTGKDKEITIPSRIKGVPVTGIASNAFCEEDYLDLENRIRRVNIPDSVTYIGNEAFAGCSGLENINIPDHVTSIGFSAFEGCSNLKKISIPGSVARRVRRMQQLNRHNDSGKCVGNSRTRL